MTTLQRVNDLWILSQLLTTLGFLLGLVLLAHLLRSQRSPASTLAWLLTILLLPYVGVPLYLMFGGRKLRQMADKKQPVYQPQRIRARETEGGPAERILRSYGVPPAREGNWIEPVGDGVKAYHRLVDLIDRAETSIHITTYILGRDRVGQAIVARLAERAAAGLTVRLLIDDVGSWWVPGRSLKALIAAGGRVARFMPVIHLPFRGRTNLRNHRKIVVIDDRYALTGGMNLAEPYMSPDESCKCWRDYSLVISGPCVADLSKLFRSDWKFATGECVAEPPDSPPPERVEGNAEAQVVASGPDVSGDPLYESLISVIFAARERIWVVTPYFIPDETLERALDLAARRGVDVRLIVPGRSNHLAADLARASYLRQVHEAGGQVLLYSRMIHAKVVLVDNDLAIVGSANMDMRSLFLNYEVAVFLSTQRQIDEAAAWVESLMAECVCGLPTRNRLRALAEDVVRLLSPLL